MFSIFCSRTQGTCTDNSCSCIVLQDQHSSPLSLLQMCCVANGLTTSYRAILPSTPEQWGRYVMSAQVQQCKQCLALHSANSTADSPLSMLIQSKSATRLWAYLLCWTSLKCFRMNMSTSSCQLSSIHFCQWQAVIISSTSLSSIMLLLLLFYGNWSSQILWPFL